jgi:acyl-coenzyme A synthetase/AMP-(fatty) acid ligase
LERTREVFIDNLFSKKEYKLYKTGDIGARIDDKNIMYYGRKDNQVKLNGFRIELDEIDSTLSKIADIEENISIIVEDDNKSKSICSFFVSKKQLDQKTIKESLKKDLPSYMLPSYMIKIDKMPLTINGKI